MFYMIVLPPPGEQIELGTFTNFGQNYSTLV